MWKVLKRSHGSSFFYSLDLQVFELDSFQRTETASRPAASPQGSTRSLTDDQCGLLLLTTMIMGWKYATANSQSSWSAECWRFWCEVCDLTRLIGHGRPGQVHGEQSHQRRLQKARSGLGLLHTLKSSLKICCLKIRQLSGSCYCSVDTLPFGIQDQY